MSTADRRSRSFVAAAFLLIAVLCDVIGASQYSKLMSTRQEHPVEASVAWTQFVGYGINAPAWATAYMLPVILFEADPSYWNAYHRVTRALGGPRLVYFGLVAIFWYFLACALGRSLRGVLTIGSRVVWAVGILYGSFLAYIVYTYQNQFAPWFAVILLSWSGLLTLVSIYFLCRDSARPWGMLQRIACIGYAVALCVVAIVVAGIPGSQPIETSVLLAISAVALGESFYFSFRRVTGPNLERA